MKRLMFAALASILTLSLSGLAFGGDLPPAVRSGKASYITGGIGKTEADAMRRAASDYPLALVLSRSKIGNFITGVDLLVQAHDGMPVLHANSAGPIVLMRLPKGQYRVKARYDGRVIVRQVEVDPATSEMLYLNWST
ncbi:MAG: hypothetical protein IH606_16965 [Burkholderiales bacterium]|nr:hypothetical protein [Burkholderiales bacterium]